MRESAIGVGCFKSPLDFFMPPFLLPSHWITMSPPDVEGPIGYATVGIFLAFLFLGIVCRVSTDHKSKDFYLRAIAHRTATFLVTMGVLGTLLFFFSYEGIQLLGARFWYPLWLLAALVWTVCIVRYATRDIPRLKTSAEVREKQLKYLPQKTKKKYRR